MRAISSIAVVGVGAMGRGIAQVAAQGGLDVLLYDAQPGAAAKGRELLAAQFDALVAKNRLTAEDAAASLARLKTVTALAELAPAGLVVEAIIEDLGVKRALFRELEGIVAPDAILASNTSSIRLASIAAACERRQRIAGLHFFNPVPLMKLVEVIAAPDTAVQVIDQLVAVGRVMGREPVVVKDGPGFLVNLGGRPFTQEALRLHHEGVATPAQIDAIMRDACGFRMGPFELLDLTGIDVNFPVSQIIHDGFMGDRRLATAPAHQALREAGRLGRKTGQGFFAYDAKGMKLPGQDDGADFVPTGPAAMRVVAVEHDDGDRDRWEALARLFQSAGAEVVAADDGQSPLVCAPLGEDATALAARHGLDHRRLVAVDLSTDLARRITIMTAPGADPWARDAVAARLIETGAKVTAIHDAAGFVAQRIRAMIANLGCEMAQTGVAAIEDIDKGMTLGLNYPQGPLALADLMGPKTVLEILTRLQAITGDDRYRPSQWLRRRALLGLSAKTPD